MKNQREYSHRGSFIDCKLQGVKDDAVNSTANKNRTTIIEGSSDSDPVRNVPDSVPPSSVESDNGDNAGSDNNPDDNQPTGGNQGNIPPSEGPTSEPPPTSTTPPGNQQGNTDTPSPLGNTIQNTLNNIQNIVVPTVNNTCQSVHRIINNPLC